MHFDLIFEKVINENTRSIRLIKLIRRVYTDLNKQITPDKLDVFKALNELKDFFSEIVLPYEKDPSKLSKDPFQSGSSMKRTMIKYGDRIKQIDDAINSDDIGELIAALDSSIDQMHVDMHFFEQLRSNIHASILHGRGAEEKDLDNINALISLLVSMGKVPKFPKTDIHGRSNIDPEISIEKLRSDQEIVNKYKDK